MSAKSVCIKMNLDQIEWTHKNHICLSGLIRELIYERMEQMEKCIHGESKSRI